MNPITQHRATIKLQPDQKLLVRGDWPEAGMRLKAVRDLVTELAGLAAQGRKAA